MSMQDVLEQIRSLLKKKKRGRISAISREIPQEMLKKQNSKQENEAQSSPGQRAQGQGSEARNSVGQNSVGQNFGGQSIGAQNTEGHNAVAPEAVEQSPVRQEQNTTARSGESNTAAQSTGRNPETLSAEQNTVSGSAEPNTAAQSTGQNAVDQNAESQNGIERAKDNMTEYRGGNVMRVIPVYNMMVLPHSYIYFQVQSFKNIAGQEIRQDDHVLLAVLKEDSFNTKDLRKEEFHSVAVEGSVTEISGDGYVVVRTGQRVKILELTQKEGEPLLLETAPLRDIEDLDREDSDRKLKEIKAELKTLVDRFRAGSIMQTMIDQYGSIQEVACILSPWLSLKNEERYQVLKEDRLSVRTKMLEQILYEYVEVTKVTSDARNQQQEDYQKLYKEQALQKQIDYLQKELDEMHPEKVSDLRKLELKIEESGMNEIAKKEASKILNRLKNEGTNGQEAGMLYDYMDFVTGLSWKKEEQKSIDLDEAEKILSEDHFGLKKVKERMIQQIAVMNLKKQQSGSILLFVGAPGTGKTSIGKSIAKALGRKYVRVSLGGVRDEADIRGHRRTYLGAMPGRIMDGIHKAGVSNPVMVLDEVDKLSSSYNGDPAAALLEVLDPEQNNTFTDHYMNVPYDLSDVLFICTANSLDTIPAPLLNRMEVIQYQGYTPREKFEIAKRHLLKKSLKGVGLQAENVEITDEALEKIISDYTREAGVRGLKKRLDTLCRIAAVHLVKGKGEKISVGKEDLREYLDMNPLHRREVQEEGKPGIITGLAWTAVGGEILYIESMFTKGEGKLNITGQLGDVMKESAQIAISLVKSMFPDKAKLFKENDLHIHVPDGATPKDGPSAGITLTIALASLVTGQAVSPRIAMTGEVSLEGLVNPIGGLPEKLMAAERAGVKTVLIPKANEDDLRDVPDEVKEKLQILPVKTVEEGMELCELHYVKPGVETL